MKNAIFILFFIMTFFSCAKEKCDSCRAITESNYKEAKCKCQGLANNYPDYDVLLDAPVGIICEDDLTQMKQLYEKYETKTLCPGVSYTIRTRLDCK